MSGIQIPGFSSDYTGIKTQKGHLRVKNFFMFNLYSEHLICVFKKME